MCKLSSQHTHTVNTRFHTGYKLITGTMLKSPTWSYIRRLAGHRIDDRKGSVHTVLRLYKASGGTWLRSARFGATPLRSAHSRSPDTQSQNSPSLENPPEAQSSSGVLLRHRTKNQRTTASCSVTGRPVTRYSVTGRPVTRYSVTGLAVTGPRRVARASAAAAAAAAPSGGSAAGPG